MDGQCLTMMGSSLVVGETSVSDVQASPVQQTLTPGIFCLFITDACVPDSNPASAAQLWSYSPSDPEKGAAITLLKNASEGAALCVDNGANSEEDEHERGGGEPPVGGCVLYGGGTPVLKQAGKSVVGGTHPGSSYSAGRGCAAKLTAAASSATDTAGAAVLWSSPSFGTTSSQLQESHMHQRAGRHLRLLCGVSSRAGRHLRLLCGVSSASHLTFARILCCRMYAGTSTE